MPPKQVSRGLPTDDDRANSIKVLCQLILSDPTFKGNNATLAPLFVISDPKNVPRKINAVINSHGYQYKFGKIVPLSAPATASSTSTTTSSSSTVTTITATSSTDQPAAEHQEATEGGPSDSESIAMDLERESDEEPSYMNYQ